ncbi:MAG: hypothetical protein OEV49_05300 [candidate division Zixibacteria bacterium]|nr:hypothetical protein [candidate division Zixibacteria bacterium]MDH3938841.1 hypothetical protein [candidate division Zixibacteria bacterium]MDH4034050.1 hypothetical protein [candidate division Zixibacteria bacterium]
MLGTHRIKNMAAMLAVMMACGVLIASAQGANVPEMINYQGYLEDANGDPVTQKTDMTFRIYDDPVLSSAVNLKWGKEDHNQVTFTGGHFSVMLGSIAPLEADDLNGPERWLEIELDNSGVPLTPRIQLTSVPYAYRVATVDGATGGDIYGDVALHSDFTLNGRIGIGTRYPSWDLHIASLDQTCGIRLQYDVTDITGWKDWYILNDYGALKLNYGQQYSQPGGYPPTMTLGPTMVGIGTENPQYTLDVDGDIRATGTIHGTLEDNHVEYTQVDFSSTQYIVNTSWIKISTFGASDFLKIENPSGSGSVATIFHSENFGGAVGQNALPGDVGTFPINGGVVDIRIVSDTHLLTLSGVKHQGALHGHVIYND